MEGVLSGNQGVERELHEGGECGHGGARAFNICHSRAAFPWTCGDTEAQEGLQQERASDTGLLLLQDTPPPSPTDGLQLRSSCPAAEVAAVEAV